MDEVWLSEFEQDKFSFPICNDIKAMPAIQGGILIMRKPQKSKVIQKGSKTRRKTIPFSIAVANKVLNAIGFVDFINNAVEWDEDPCKVAPGLLAKAVVLATFLDIRAPLSRISETFATIDTELLFGRGVAPEHLNDCAIGRTLDKIANSEMSPDTMYSTLCLVAYSVYKIAFKRLYSDTTSVSFYGDYDVANDPQLTDQEILQIVSGYNKDGRPECNQVVVGKIVNEHGIPLVNSVMDGNTSDVAWNATALEMISSVFQRDLDQCIYVADSKRMTMSLFRTMMDPDKTIRFISRCPTNFSETLAARVTAQAYMDSNWTTLEPFSTGKNASQYESQEYNMVVDGRVVRCIVYKTSEGTAKFLRKKEVLLDTLKEDIKAAQKKEFVCEADAKKEQQRFEKAQRNSIFRCSYTINPVHTERRPRGNPGKNPKPPMVDTKWHLQIEIVGDNPEPMQKLKHKNECFVIITNVPAQECDMWAILDYKNQSVVKIQFRLLRQPCIGSVIYLKTPQRIRSLVMLLGVSLLITALVQYTLRKGFQENTDKLPKVGWNGATLHANLTMFFLKSAMVNHAFIREGRHEYSYAFTDEVSELRICTLLKLMGLTVEELIE